MGDYLWDKSGQPDPDVQQYEEVLESLRGRPPLPVLPPRQGRRWGHLWLRAAAAAAAILLAGVFVWVRFVDSAPVWTVAAITGAPRVGSRLLASSARLHVGELVETDANSRASLSVGHIAKLEVEPGTSVEIVRSHPSEYRLSLQRGKLHASISARPKLFFVDTPAAVAIDLGCGYTLEVDDAGNSIVEVTGGMVSVEAANHEALIPAGAICIARRRLGPGTPYYRDASPALIHALDRFDVADDRSCLPTILSEARKKDVLTLWHLVGRTEGADRAAVAQLAEQYVPLPQGVAASAILDARQDALEQWWVPVRAELSRIRKFEKESSSH